MVVDCRQAGIGRAARGAPMLIGALAFALAGTAVARDDAPQAEVQVALCGKPADIERALDLRARGKPLEVWLFDDAALVLFERGLRLRLRHGAGESSLTLKVADQDCARLAKDLLPRGEGKCEYDLHGDKLAGAVSLSHKLAGAGSTGAGQALIDGRMQLANALSAAQARYLRQVVKLWPLPSDLRALGPIALTTYRTGDKRYDVDVTRLPDGAQYVEISTKVPVPDAPRARRQLGDDLARAAVETCADQSAQAVNKLRALLRRP